MKTFTQIPRNFQPTKQAAGCFVESEGQFLYLKRAPSRISPNTWCLPAGSIEPGEDPRTAVIREVFEETGLFIDTADLKLIGPLYIQRPDLDYIFHIFYKPFLHRPKPQLNHEHTEFQWVSVPHVSSLPLIPGGEEVLNFFLNQKKG